jgi:hypothetical protein
LASVEAYRGCSCNLVGGHLLRYSRYAMTSQQLFSTGTDIVGQYVWRFSSSETLLPSGRIVFEQTAVHHDAAGLFVRVV